MEFEWDKRKNSINIEKHGIDFHDAESVFQSKRLSIEDSREEYGEKRIITVGRIGNVVNVVVYTMRNEKIRIISARRANERERRRYYEKIGEAEIKTK